MIITGGGSGIGLAIAQECAALGARLALGARDQARLEASAEALRAQGAEVWTAPLNIRDDEAARDWVAACAAHFGRLDVLVNNAGGQFPAPALDIRPKGWRAVIDTNLNGTWWMTQAVAEQFLAQTPPDPRSFPADAPPPKGKIINIVANMWRGFPGMAHTGAARAGVVNLTRTLALEWSQHPILVNTVAPGVIHSSGLDTYPEAIQRRLLHEVPQQIPLGRLGRMREVAWAVVWLASEAGHYVTGETLCVDGGQQHAGEVFAL